MQSFAGPLGGEVEVVIVLRGRGGPQCSLLYRGRALELLVVVGVVLVVLVKSTRAWCTALGLEKPRPSRRQYPEVISHSIKKILKNTYLVFIQKKANKELLSC